MRTYELMTVLRPDLGSEDDYTAYVETLQGFVSDENGEIVDVDHSSPWGRRKLAYEIDDYQDGYYVLMHIQLDPQRVPELERSMKLATPILRYLLIRQDTP